MLRPGNVVFPSILGEQHTLDRPNHPLGQSHVDEVVSSRPSEEQHFLTRPHSIISTTSGSQYLPHLVSSSPVHSEYDEFRSSIDRPQIIVNADNIYIGNHGFEHLSLHRNSGKDLPPLAPARHFSIPLKMPFMYQWLTAKSPHLTARPSMSNSAELVSQKFNLNPILTRITTKNGTGPTEAVIFALSPLYLRVNTLDSECISVACKLNAVTSELVNTLNANHKSPPLPSSFMIEKNNSFLPLVMCSDTSSSACPFAVPTPSDKPNEQRTNIDTKHYTDDLNELLDSQNVGNKDFMPLMGSSTELLLDEI